MAVSTLAISAKIFFSSFSMTFVILICSSIVGTRTIISFRCDALIPIAVEPVARLHNSPCPAVEARKYWLYRFWCNK